jgi:hypothetical protein
MCSPEISHLHAHDDPVEPSLVKYHDYLQAVRANRSLLDDA